ncbi:hypothetical protein HDZ31DRAFT_36171, partial [Schizophyllum fasciatum]
LRARLAAFNDALLASDPPIAGLDKSIVIDPRRVHLTLGVMCLEREDAISPVHAATDVNDASNIDANPTSATSGTASLPDSPPKKTIASALALLRSLAPQLMALGPARVDLDRLGVLKTQKGGREANVLWVGPRDEGDLVHQAFRRERYITETRPLKLHVTLLNTTHRKKPRRRLAFSYVDVLRAEAAMGVDIAMSPPPSAPLLSNTFTVPRTPIPIALGSYTVRAVHLCAMGSHGPDNEYVSVGGVEF